METHTAAFAIIREAAKAGFRVPKRLLDYNERSRLITSHRRESRSRRQRDEADLRTNGSVFGIGDR
jgi:hypothetical protein